MDRALMWDMSDPDAHGLDVRDRLREISDGTSHNAGPLAEFGSGRYGRPDS